MGKSSGLIITLIIFIILTITLGIVTYSLAQPYKEATIKLAEAVKKSEQAEKEIRALNEDIEKIKGKVGYPALKTADQVVQSMSADINRALANASQAPKTYREAIAAMAQMVNVVNQGNAEYKRQSEEYRVLADSEVKKSRAQKAAYDEQRRAAETSFTTQKEKDAKKLKDLETSFQELTKKVDRIELEAKKLNEKYRVEAADAEEVAAAIADINTSLSLKLDELSNADFDVPDGTILYVNQVDRTLRLNIGKVEGLRVLTRFGVYPHDTLQLGSIKPKGAIEVTRILGDHLSEARIVEDEISAPFMPGDIVYTPLWKSGQQVLYALTYNMDIDGDGKSDVEALKNLIDSTGSRVVLWVTDDGQVQGKLTPDITAIITSNKPITDVLAVDNKLDPATKEKILGEQMKLLKEAHENNIREVKLAEFLRKVHYRPAANVDRYKEDNGIARVPMGNVAPTVSKGPVAPIYIPGKQDKPPVSQGPVSSIYGETRKTKAPVSQGKVSDYYFRKRAPSGM